MKANRRILFFPLFLAGLVFIIPGLAAAQGPLPPSLPSAQSPFAASFLQTLSPAEISTLMDAYQRRELTPAARAVIEANPALKAYLPPEINALLESTEAEGVPGAADNAALLKKGIGLPGLGLPGFPVEEFLALSKKYDWKKSVYVSRLFLSRLGKEEARQLVHFGHELFDPSRDKKPLMGDSYPVSDDYVIGPGDEIIVKLWGRMEGSHRMRVDRDGKIFFPKLGPMYLSGKTFGELKTFLRNKVGAIAEVRADISLGELKGFLVSVLGEVKTPGKYHVSSYHTVLQAITMAEGIRDIGSFRQVQVKRGAETIAELDIYDYLLRGDVTGDIRMQAGDAVFVPVAGPMVAVVGEVRRQAIYELKKEKTIPEVLAMAGGISPSAYRRRIQVERLEGNLARMVVDLSLEEIEKSLSGFALQDGDILRVLAVLPEEENVVQVEGNVHRPGKYEWKAGVTVGSLIPDEKFFLPETYLDYALITRLVGPERRKEAVPVDLRRIVIERDSSADVALQPRDTLTVYNKSAFREVPKAKVEGEVRKPGEYEVHPGMRVSDLVKLGGDLTRNASLEDAELARIDEKKNTVLMKIDLGKALAGVESDDIPVQDQDRLMVRPVPDLQEVRYVTLTGEVVSPGVYAARKGERLSSIIRRAGGFTKDAFPQGAVYTRVSVQKRQQELIDQTVEQLEQEVARTAAKEGATALDTEDIAAQRQIFEARKTLLTRLKQLKAQGRIVIRLSEPDKLEGTENNLLVENGDKLEVPREAEVVNILGRVYNPTAVVYNEKRDNVGYYLSKVGGPTEDADERHMFVVKADGSVVTENTGGEGWWFFGSGDFLNARVEPGDSIVVPEKLVYTRIMKDIKDITQILYQIAVTAGVLIVAF